MRVLRPVRDLPRRVATISVHTSPLDQPGTGDAGGMNVYVVELSRRLAAAGVEVDVFTRKTSSDQPPVVETAPGVRVRHVPAGPLEGLDKNELPAQLCAFAAGVMRAEASHEPGYYDLVHSHYWLSGQVGWLAKERWGVPLVHSMHTMARVKNAALADGDAPEPGARTIGEGQVVEAADRLLASTDAEARELVELYDADPARVRTIAPGVDLEVFRPGDVEAARARLGIAADADVLAFAGRIQPLKAPDVLLRAVARLVDAEPWRRQRLVVLVVGGPSGSGREHPEHLSELARELGIADLVRFEQPVAQDSAEGAEAPGGYSEGAEAPAGYSAEGAEAPAGYSAEGAEAPAGYSAEGAEAPAGYSAEGAEAPKRYSAEGAEAPKRYSAEGAEAPKGYGLADVFRAASVVAVPSYNESFGLVALEAQACGTPVVGAAVGGLTTAVDDGVTGLLVDGHDPGAWAAALRRLLAEPGLRDRLAAGALGHAERFGWSATAAGALDVYRQVLVEAAAPQRAAVGG